MLLMRSQGSRKADFVNKPGFHMDLKAQPIVEVLLVVVSRGGGLVGFYFNFCFLTAALLHL